MRGHAWPATQALLPAALLLVAPLRSVRALLRQGAPRGYCAWSLLRVPPTLLPACLLAAGPCSHGSCFRCLASIRGSIRRGRAGRDSAPRPYLVSDPLFPALLG